MITAHPRCYSNNGNKAVEKFLAHMAFCCCVRVHNKSQLDGLCATGGTILSPMVDFVAHWFQAGSCRRLCFIESRKICVFRRLQDFSHHFRGSLAVGWASASSSFYRRAFPLTSPPSLSSSSLQLFLALATLWSARDVTTPALAAKCSRQPSLLDSICIQFVLYLDVIGSIMFRLQHASALLWDLGLNSGLKKLLCSSWFHSLKILSMFAFL